MNDHEQSDGPVVPTKPTNKAEAKAAAAELVEERGPAKRNLRGGDTPRTQRRIQGVPSALARIREAARRDGKQRFTSLMHHIYDVARLRKAYQALRRGAARGVDGVTWEAYGQDLERNLEDLSRRLAHGGYRAQPARRVLIPKADGGKRPIGVPTLEDKIVQRAAAEVLSAIYEADFLGFSYGFRPGRSQHHALDALAVGVMSRKVGWVLDADIRGFFDTLDHEWLMKFVEHRIGDQRVLRLLRKWLKAGVLEDGVRITSATGAVQGGSISPLLANVYLHYVLDLWVQRWRTKQTDGDLIIVRYADDVVVGFQRQHDGERFQRDLSDRLGKFGLELHPDKTRLIEFGRFAATNRTRRGLGKPETFNFLGFTHVCGKTRRGKFVVRRKTSKRSFQGKLRQVRERLRRNLNATIPEMGSYLAAVVRGHAQYFGVPFNHRAIASFRWAIVRIWKWVLERRSERTHISWARMQRLSDRWIPAVRICHPHPGERFRVTTRGRSRMR